jgi:uncharacterized protein (TIRG00374 family)
MDKKSTAKKIIWMVISLLLAVFTVKAVMSQSKNLSFGELMETVREADIRWIIVAVASSLLYVWFEGKALRTILRETGYPRKPLQGLLYSTADVYFSAVTPSATGGQPASAYFMIKDGVPTGIVTAALVLNLIMYNAAIGMLGIVAVILQPHAILHFSTVSYVFIAIGVAALTGLSTFFYLMLKKGEKVFRSLRRFILFLSRKKILKDSKKYFGKLRKVEKEYAECSRLITDKPDLLVKTFLWNFLQRASQILVPMFLYLAMGQDAWHAPLLFSKQCLINIGYNFIPIPGAMGISDYLMLDGFQSLMPEEMAFELELLSRGTTFYFCVTLCGIITLTGYLLRRKKK